MTDPNAAVAPGWYSLPDGRLGYWDGTGWAAVSDAPPPAVASAPPTTEPTPETAAITADAPADVAPVLEPDAEPASAEPADPVADERAVVAEPAVVVDPVAPVPVLEPTVIDDATPPVVAAAVAFDPDAPPTGPPLAPPPPTTLPAADGTETAPPTGYWKAWRTAWPWVVLTGLAGFAIIGGLVALGRSPFSIVSGAIDGAIAVLFWGTIATFLVAAITRTTTPDTRASWRARRRTVALVLTGLIVAGTALAGIRVATSKPAATVTAAQTPQAKAYLTSHYTCANTPTVDTTTVGRVGCAVAAGHGILVQAIPHVAVDPDSFRGQMALEIAKGASQGIDVNYTVVTDWQADYDLVVMDITKK